MAEGTPSSKPAPKANKSPANPPSKDRNAPQAARISSKSKKKLDENHPPKDQDTLSEQPRRSKRKQDKEQA